LKAGLSTYGYVAARPLIYNDPLGLADSTIQCDGKGEYEVVNLNKGCDKACTDMHEQSHIEDWKKRYGADSCKNKAKGYLQLGGPGYSDFLDQSECKAYRIGKACREKAMGTGACDCSAGIKRDIDEIKGHKCATRGF
jgi:hypothetical protein